MLCNEEDVGGVYILRHEARLPVRLVVLLPQQAALPADAPQDALHGQRSALRDDLRSVAVVATTTVGSKRCPDLRLPKAVSNVSVM